MNDQSAFYSPPTRCGNRQEGGGGASSHAAQVSGARGCAEGQRRGREAEEIPPADTDLRPGRGGAETVRTAFYPVLIHEARRRGIGLEDMAAHIGASAAELHGRLFGRGIFTREEACAIHEKFFQDVDTERLFQRAGAGQRDRPRGAAIPPSGHAAQEIAAELLRRGLTAELAGPERKNEAPRAARESLGRHTAGRPRRAEKRTEEPV